MPRKARVLLPLSCYHVMTRGNNRNKIFRDTNDYQKYISILAKYKHIHPFDLYHYCLMPTHTHFLIKVNNAKSFSMFMKQLNLSYYYYYKNKYGWVGHFFQGRFKSKPVGKDEYFIQCGKYIELNPVRDKIVTDPKDYNHSSYRHYAYGEKNSLITTDFVFEQMTGSLESKQRKYQNLVVDEQVEVEYNNMIWGSSKQRYNEQKKINYRLKKDKITKIVPI